MLTDKQRRFVEEYLANGKNGALAYRTVYGGRPTAKLAAEEACKLLVNPKIRPIIAEARTRAEERTWSAVERYAISRERLVAELASVAFASMGDYFLTEANGQLVADFSGLTPRQRAAISSFSEQSTTNGTGSAAGTTKRTRLSLHNKVAALAALASLMGFTGQATPQRPNSAAADGRQRDRAELIKELVGGSRSAPTPNQRGPSDETS